MTSNTTTGERRWASARRGGMTVLGKVPKPINLPSQRLENHGLDPNVEIVPKGTLGWGSKSSGTTNAWGTSAVSPSTDGTRPSSAGSEIGHDSNVNNAWSSNSRPSSASGSSASSCNKVQLASLRPRSAETRPASSQLSRFAESSLDSGAWGGPTATSERIGHGNSGKDGFSLSSGDFPTLGSEKEESRMNSELRDNIPRNADTKDSSTWRKDGPSYEEDRPRSSSERCNEDPHPYQNPNIGPHYESWRGQPPVNPTGPMWYGGPLRPPPYGAPSGFPMDPFYYPRGVGPHGHYPTNADMYRPHHMHESYMCHPNMPVAPGFYPGPLPCEGYYGPPSMGLCNPNDRAMPFIGMPTPPLYNRPINLNMHRAETDHTDTCHPRDPREITKVLRKQSDCWSQNDEERSGYKGRYALNQEKGILSNAPIQGNSWGEDDKKGEDMHFEKGHTRSIEHEVGSSIPTNNVEGTDMTRVIENVPSPAHSLIQKIEGLNAKARSSSDEQHQSVIDANSNIVLERHYPSGVLVPVSHDMNSRSSETTVPIVTTATSRKFAPGAQSRSNHGKESDGWRKRSESHAVVSPKGSGSSIENQVIKHRALYPGEASSESNVVHKREEESVNAQGPEMKEIAKQRAIQIQKEEEERIRDQKAKALAKLEELNRRSANRTEENPGFKMDSVPSLNATAPLNHDGPKNHMELKFGTHLFTNTISGSTTDFVPKNEIGAGDSSDSTVPVKTTSRDSSLSQNRVPISDVNVHQKKNKSGKNKNKLEELPATVTNDPNITEPKDVAHTSENHSSLSHEDAHTRQNSLPKNQNSRKPRSSQGNRSEKSHNSDTVVWAPVRPHSKVETVDETSGDNVAPKMKRAEMERYVPKPVAKELAQQGSIQQSQHVTPTMASKHVDGKHKQRGQGSRSHLVNVVESVSVQVSHDASAVVTGGTNIGTRNGSGKNVKSDHELPMKGPKVIACDDGWNSPNDSEFSSSDAFGDGKDNFHHGRGKRHYSFKGHKGTGTKAGSNDFPHAPIVTGQTESTMPSKESRVVGDRAMSQWKPKAQGNRSHNHQTPISEGTNKAMKRETGYSSHGVARDPVASEGTDVGGGGTSSLGHENKTDKSVSSVRGRAAPTNQRFVSEVAFGSFNVSEAHNHIGGFFNKGSESQQDWNSTEQENVQRSNAQFEYRSQPNDEGVPQREYQSGGGTKYRGRGQSHARRGRGNFYGRQRGTRANTGNE